MVMELEMNELTEILFLFVIGTRPTMFLGFQQKTGLPALQATYFVIVSNSFCEVVHTLFLNAESQVLDEFVFPGIWERWGDILVSFQCILGVQLKTCEVSVNKRHLTKTLLINYYAIKLVEKTDQIETQVAQKGSKEMALGGILQGWVVGLVDCDFFENIDRSSIIPQFSGKLKTKYGSRLHSGY